MRVAFLTYFSHAFQVIRMRLWHIRFAYVLASVLLSCYACMCVLLSYFVSCICVTAYACMRGLLYHSRFVHLHVCHACMRVLLNFSRFVHLRVCYTCMRILLKISRCVHFVSVTPVCVFLLNHSRLRTFPRFLPPYRVVSVAFIDVNLICKSGLSRMARLGSFIVTLLYSSILRHVCYAKSAL